MGSLADNDASLHRARVSLLLIAGMFVIWSAVALRIDLFPLTWAPMYSVLRDQPMSIGMVQEGAQSRGVLAFRRDGRVERINARQLNVPKWSFWRITHERLFGRGPNKHIHGNAPMGPLLRSIHGLTPGELKYEANWDWRILRSVNESLGRAEGDPSFIVRIEHEVAFAHLDRAHVSTHRVTRETARVRWNPAWSMDREAL